MGWTRNGGGEVDVNFVEKELTDVQKLTFDRISKKVENLDSKIQNMQEHYEEKMSDTKLEYEFLFTKIADKQNQAEKKALQKFNNLKIKQKQFSQEITDIRERYSNLKDDISNDKTRVVKILEEQYVVDLDDFVENYKHDSELKIVWNLGIPTFEISYILSLVIFLHKETQHCVSLVCNCIDHV